MNKIKQRIYILLRNYLLKDITGNLGKVEITYDKIVCYVNNKKLKKTKKRVFFPAYELLIRSRKMCPEEILDAYKINKPIEYIIKDMNFKTSIKVIAPKDTTIKFFNCNFNREICILSGGEIILENNQYCDEDLCYLSGTFFYAKDVKKLKFVNDKFINQSEDKIKTKFGMKIDVDNLEMINSIFELSNSDGSISISSNDVYINNSYIKGNKEVYIKANNLKASYTRVNLETKFIIENKNNNHDFLNSNEPHCFYVIDNEKNNYNMDVICPKFIYNGINLNKYFSSNSKRLELKSERTILIKKLKELREDCVKIISNENTLNNKSIVKTIKNR